MASKRNFGRKKNQIEFEGEEKRKMNCGWGKSKNKIGFWEERKTNGNEFSQKKGWIESFRREREKTEMNFWDRQEKQKFHASRNGFWKREKKEWTEFRRKKNRREFVGREEGEKWGVWARVVREEVGRGRGRGRMERERCEKVGK